MPEFRSRWLEFSVDTPSYATAKTDKSSSVSSVSAVVGHTAPDSGVVAATPETDRRVPLGYVATLRAFMGRWVALGRPVLTLPRPRFREMDYYVPDVGQWFLLSIADPPSNAWVPRTPVELADMGAALTALELNTIDDDLRGGD